MSKPNHEDKSESNSNESIGGAKLTNRLIDQGLLTKNMIDELRSEWADNDKKKEANRKNRRSKDRKSKNDTSPP